MSNVTNLFDYKSDETLILEFVNFLAKRCCQWLDQKSYEHFHSAETLNMLINIKKLVPRSDELKIAYINFTKRFHEDNLIEFGALLKTIDDIENQKRNINALTCSTADWSNLNNEAKPKPPILCAIVAIRIFLEEHKFVLKYDVWRSYSLILNENGREEYVSVQIDSIIREWRNWIYEHKGVMHSLEILKDAFHQIAKNNEFHSQQKKVRSITWDGVDRYVAGVKALGLDDSEFTSKALRHHLLASMARLFYPGVWYDLIFCVFGDQGAGKTTGLRILYGRDNTISVAFFEMDAKRKSEVTRHGIWAVENPDTLGDARKADFNKIKGDQSIDSFLGRDAYGRVEDIRRHNITYVVWYTGNEVRVLRDRTGNRRYIIAFSIGPIDEDWLRLNADQWWAQIYVEMEKLRSDYLEAQHLKHINDEYPKYLELPRELWEESKKRSDAAMVDAPPWEDWLPEIIFQPFVTLPSPKSNKSSMSVLTRDILKYLHEKCPRNTSISDQALAAAMSKIVILSKNKDKDLQEDIKWTPKQIPVNGANLRGYRIDFAGEGKLRAFELIKKMVADKKLPEDAFIANFNDQPF